VKKIGIVICNRYHTCAGGKCLRALRNREGAFALYEGEDVELVGYTTCGGCPGGNVEYAPAEMKKNGAGIIHLATGLVVGYPPCPRLQAFCDFIPAQQFSFWDCMTLICKSAGAENGTTDRRFGIWPQKMKLANSLRMRGGDGTARVNTIMSPWCCVL
jgi:predicted metal-binding protein